MTTIRGNLLRWLLPGYLVLWGVAGSAVYLSVAKRFEFQLDSRLREILAALPFADGAGSGGVISFEDFAGDDFGIYFDVHSAAGETVLKSENLGRLNLPRPPSFSAAAEFRNVTLENGDPVRTLSIRSEGGLLGTLDIVVATTREEAVHSLFRTGIAVGVTGLVLGLAFALFVVVVLRRGLRPLRALGEKAGSIDAHHLSERFETETLPGEIRPIAASLNLLLGKLESGFEREKQFGADLAHELRTPVAAIRTTAEVALKWPEQASKENYEDILEISGVLQSIVENLLHLARLDQSGNPRQIEPVAMRSVIQDLLPLFEPRIRERSLTVVVRVGDSDRIQSDAQLIRIVVSNLIENAVEHSPTGSEIRIENSGDEILRVSNVAQHLLPADLDRMFDRLWRHDQARTDGSHCGLGLALAKSAAVALSLDLFAELNGNLLSLVLKKFFRD